jgi:hypothetical protein
MKARAPPTRYTSIARSSKFDLLDYLYIDGKAGEFKIDTAGEVETVYKFRKLHILIC